MCEARKEKVSIKGINLHPDRQKLLDLFLVFFVTLGKCKRMTFEKTCVIKNNELTIKLPKNFRSVKKVRVIVEEVENERSKKIKLLKKASTDPLFNSDIEEIKNDFRYSDKEAI